MNRKKEQGIALLYVLGILALLIAMAMAFMNSSIFDQRASAQSASSIMAEQLAISTMQRLIWGIQQPAASGLSETTASFSYMPDNHYGYNGASSSAGSIARDGLDIGLSVDDTTVKKDILYVDDLKNHFDYKNTNYRENVRWMLHRMQVGDDNYQIIGRTAFILVPLGGGKINPSYLVNPTLNELPSGLYPETRIGKHMDEINIKAISGVFLPDDVVRFFNYPAQSGGNRPPAGWDENFFSTLKTTLYPTTRIPKQVHETIDEAFTFTTQDSPEYYLMDIDNDKVFTDRERIHRFYLPRFTNTGEYWDRNSSSNIWDTLDINKDILLDEDNDGTPDIDLAPDTVGGGYRFDNTTASAVQGIGLPWLALYGYKDNGSGEGVELSSGDLDYAEIKGTFSTIKARRQQIAANLKDYCDSDSIPTSDVTPSSWGYESPHIPTYTGNEKTPYINELEVATDFTFSVVDNSGSGGSRTATGTVDMYMAGEIVNIYKNLGIPDKSSAPKTKLQLLFRIANAEMTIEWDGNAAQTKSIDMDTSGGSGLTNHPIGADSNYYTINLEERNNWVSGIDGHFSASSQISSAFIFAVDAIESGGPPPTLPNTGKMTIKYQIKIDKAILEYVDGNVDYVKIDKDIIFNTGELHFDLGGILATEVNYKGNNIVHSVQTEDPRQNLNPDDWKLYAPKYSTSDYPSISNIGKINDLGKPNAPDAAAGEFDIELAASPAYAGDAPNEHLSTAYIRNAPMISPWELGLIHRGAKWQTINLKKYNHDKAFKTTEVGSKYYLVGGGLYSEGDANILDQIKMTPDKESPLKVNLKGTGEMVLNGLLDVQKMGVNATSADFVGRAALDSTSPSASYFDINPATATLCKELLGSSGSPSTLNTVNSETRDKFDPAKTTGEFDTRAALANITGINNGGTTDAAQEEWIGKIVNLTEARKGLDLFEIVIVSQAIQDVGGANGSSINIKKGYHDPDHKLVVSSDISSKLGEVNFVEETTNKIIVLSDEILAQRKIRVRGYRKPDGNVQILSIKTVE